MNYQDLESSHLRSIEELVLMFQDNTVGKHSEKLRELSFYHFLLSAQTSYLAMFALFADEMLFCELTIPEFTCDDNLAKANLESYRSSFQFDFADPRMKPFIAWYNLQIRRYENFLSICTRNHPERDVEMINFVAVSGTQKLRVIMGEYLMGLATTKMLESLSLSTERTDPNLSDIITAKLNEDNSKVSELFDNDEEYN